MSYLILSTSRNPASRSRILAQECMKALAAQAGDDQVTWLDAGTMDLPICDGAEAWNHPSAVAIKDALERASGVVLASGVYNYNASAAAKTVVELGASAWNDKVVAVCCAAGGAAAQMAPMSLITSLMLDFRCVIVPRYVYATGADFVDDAVTEQVQERVDQLAEDLHRLTSCIASGT